ncbi:MAG TPA: L,D-transpeptidase [Xanthobacteraceae bacterium]|nr:L,D-transpeptidase [Xanthobacteraceae bacterium]
MKSQETARAAATAPPIKGLAEGNLEDTVKNFFGHPCVSFLRFSQAGAIVFNGPWNKKSPLCPSGAFLFGLAVGLLALPPAQASAKDLHLAISGRAGYQPQFTTRLSSYGDPWSGLRQAPDARYEVPTSEETDPRFFRRVVDYPTHEKPGSIVIDTRGRYLYYVERQGKAIRYGIGVGRPGFEWAGVKTVSQKKEWPEWRPPADMLARRPNLPIYMAGGAENPLGARAVYLGPSLYRIHGSNEPATIGLAVSSGCIRMKNEDVIDLYDRVKIGTRVVVI